MFCLAEYLKLRLLETLIDRQRRITYVVIIFALLYVIAMMMASDKIYSRTQQAW